jgi:hypothetical protein
VFLLLIPLALGAGAEDFGEPLELAESIRIADLLSDPEAYVGQRVRVEGLVDDVCPMMGCWIDILEEQSQETIRFKVDDDVIVFPVEAKGQEVVAEGVLAKIEMDEQDARRWLAHQAEEKGEAFDPETVSGPMTVYRIDGIGAQIH